MPDERLSDDMFEARMFLILGIAILSILNVLVLLRAGSALLLADLRVLILFLITIAGWILIALGIHRFMRGALDLDALRGEPAAPSDVTLKRLETLRRNRRKVLSDRVLPIAILITLVLVLVLWL